MLLTCTYLGGCIANVSYDDLPEGKHFYFYGVSKGAGRRLVTRANDRQPITKATAHHVTIFMTSLLDIPLNSGQVYFHTSSHVCVNPSEYGGFQNIEGLLIFVLG